MTISDVGKWGDKRHRQLSVLEKVVYDFFWDNSNRAGFYKIADADSDCFQIGCSTDQYREAIRNLCKPKDKPGSTDKQRGFVLVGAIVWISHKLKHTQKSFGKVSNNAHKAAMDELMEYYHDFENEQEYIDVLDEVSEEVFEFLKVISHRKLNRLNSNTIPVRNQETKAAPKIGTDPITKVYQIFRKETKKDIVQSSLRDNKIRNFMRDTGHDLDDIEKVVKNRFDAWKDDNEMNKHLTIETILSPEKFTKYLEDANNKKSKPGLVIGQDRQIHN